MANPHHHTMSQLTDPHPVRPGTSAALTARTIDATIHPPIVRAQEAVAAFIPRVTEPLSSLNPPLIAGMLGGTLMLLWIAHRIHFRPAGLLVSAMLMMMLTSFHPVAQPVQVAQADDAIVGSSDTWTPRDRYQMPRASDETPNTVETPDVADTPPIPDPSYYPDIEQTPAPMARGEPDLYYEPDVRGRGRSYRVVVPQPSGRMMPMEDLMRLEQEQMREQLRASLEVLERRLRAEARRSERELRRRW